MITKNLKYYLLAFLLVVAVYCGQAQQYGPSDPTGNPEQSPPLGGGAPVGGGLGILLVLGAAYGVRKFYSPTEEDEED